MSNSVRKCGSAVRKETRYCKENLVSKLAMLEVRPEPLPGAPRQPTSRDLPVRRQKDRIVGKVQENRVTLIFADTGSGKSSQVPQMLLEENLGPILCTQPRRLAVVAVAKRVAQELGCALGDEVGYQIGQLNLSTTRTKIVFKTAGILFEELRTNGPGALSRYKVVILDEVHERSVESDLVLTCMKQIIRTTSVKLVLMSATADLLKYEEYFKDVGEEGVEKIAIQNIAEKLRSVILNTKVIYLEHAVKKLGNKPHHEAVLDSLKENCAPAEKGLDIGDSTQNLIKDLIVHLHHSDPDFSKNVLVFLPTYRILEQQWLLLKATREPFQVHVLHSSIDMEHSMRAMEACPLQQRKIILATNVAESSITIPGVSFVVDACRHLEVYWDNSLKRHQPRIVWVSESQAKQRKGRAGRTCDGIVFRLVPRNQYLKFEKFETPSMQLLSLRKQVLMILCASSKALNDPAALLGKSMNPPMPDTVRDALETLEDMNASHTDVKGKHRPTLYGQLLVSLPLSLEASVLVVRGGQLGYLRESAVLAAIWDCTPNPILKPFGDPKLYQINVESYYKPADSEQGQSYLPHPTIMLANLHAYEFWQQSFKDKCRVDSLLQLANRSRLHINSSEKYDEEVVALDWCTQHRLSLTSLRSVAETVDTVIEALHRFRPEFLCKMSGPPSYIITDNLQHACFFGQPSNGDSSCDTPDAWNGWSFQESGASTVEHKNNDQGTSSPAPKGDDDVDPWNDWSFQGSGTKSVEEHKNNDQATTSYPAPKGDDFDPWNDWSFQQSEQSLSGHGKVQVNGSHEGAFQESEKSLSGYGQVNGSHEGESNGQAKWGDEQHQNRNKVDHSNDCSDNGKLHGSHQHCGDGEANGRDEVRGTDQLMDKAELEGSSADDLQTCTSVPYTQSGTFHTPEAEQILTALLVETQRGTQQKIVSEFVGETLGDQLSSPTPMCSYFEKGMCNKGENCLFSHSPNANPVLCKFFKSPTGCRYGDACRYSHNAPKKYVLPSDDEPLNFEEPAPTAQSMLDLLPVLNDNEFFLLVGEGDFSFAEGLSSYIDPRKIFATSLDKEEVFSTDPVLSQRLTRLTNLEMRLMWNVDLTSLVSSSGKGKIIASANLTRSIPWSRVKCILWNFPYADGDENTAKHQELMSMFFASLSVIMISSKLHPIPVILTLCNDQYCRWQVERAARNAFFFLKTSVPFDVNTFGGYCPVRNNLRSTFPVHRPLIYMFELNAPKSVVEEGSNEDF